MSPAPKLSDALEDAISRAARAVQRRAQTLRDPAGEAWSQDVEDFAEDIRGEVVGQIWFFVYENGGDAPLAAFPSRELAEMYSANTEWEIREHSLTF